MKNLSISRIVPNLHSFWLKFCFEMLFTLSRNPWKYTSNYQQRKYERELELLPSNFIGKALEIGCAEGHFTVKLAPRVSSLIATDISRIALGRAAKLCEKQQLYNVRFMHLDIVKDSIPECFDLIFCSEVLYYVGSVIDLQKIASKIAVALKPGGYLITTNDLRVKNQVNASISPNSRLFGAKVIGETLSNTPPLRLLKEIRTPFYYTQLFQRQEEGYFASSKQSCEVIELSQSEMPLKEKSVFDLFSVAAIYDAWRLIIRR